MTRFLAIIFFPLLLAGRCPSQTVMLSWSTNNQYVNDWTVMESTNAGLNWFSVTNGDFGSCVIAATNQQPAPVWVTNVLPGGCWSNDCTAYNQFMVIGSLGNDTPFTTLLFSNGLPYFTNYWVFAANVKLSITKQ